MNALGSWIVTQLASPSTHNAIAVAATALQSLIPPPWNIIAPLFFAFLGVVIPEQGEKP